MLILNVYSNCELNKSLYIHFSIYLFYWPIRFFWGRTAHLKGGSWFIREEVAGLCINSHKRVNICYRCKIIGVNKYVVKRHNYWEKVSTFRGGRPFIIYLIFFFLIGVRKAKKNERFIFSKMFVQLIHNLIPTNTYLVSNIRKTWFKNISSSNLCS